MRFDEEKPFLPKMAAPDCFHGEVPCSAVSSGKACPRRAYYLLGGCPVCGRHNRGKAGTPLPRNPGAAAKAEATDQRRRAAIAAAQAANAQIGNPGIVALAGLRLMKAPERLEGYIAVFPNHRAGSRVTPTTFNCCALSPMVIGPIEHGQPGLPPARCLENWFQAQKVFKSEVATDGSPLPVWYERRLALYNDPVPHRHKLGKSKAEHLRAAGGKPGENANAALYSLYVRRDGTEERCSYVESRKYYCHFYEVGARQTPAFAELSRLRRAGHNLQIFDPDGCSLSSYAESDFLREVVRGEYANPARPFGHGKVLFTMLALPRDDWPWVRFFPNPAPTGVIH